MARDSQAALVALNRFGFGARGGASGDFVNAASDPRGFVKAEFEPSQRRAAGSAGIAADAGAGQAVFDYQFEVKQARDAAAKSGAPAPTEGPPPARGCEARSGATCRSTSSRMRYRRKTSAAEAGNAGRRASNADAAMRRAEATQPRYAPKPPPQPLNIIQKTFRAEALARMQRARDRRLRICRAAGGVLVQPFLHLRQQGRAGADVGGLVRARGDPAACARAVSPTC